MLISSIFDVIREEMEKNCSDLSNRKEALLSMVRHSISGSVNFSVAANVQGCLLLDKWSESLKNVSFLPNRRHNILAGQNNGSTREEKSIKWYVDFDKCIPYFTKTHGCTICIEVCPW